MAIKTIVSKLRSQGLIKRNKKMGAIKMPDNWIGESVYVLSEKEYLALRWVERKFNLKKRHIMRILNES